MRFVGICGTPGTGKKTIAPLVAGLMNLPAISINSLVPKGESEVDTDRVRTELLKTAPPRAVLFGHLLPHVLKRPEAGIVAVLRCEPSVLRERLSRRGYPEEKVNENVEAELIGVLLYECVRRFGVRVVREYDTTSTSPEEVARRIAMDARPARATRRKARKVPNWIDWTLDYDSSSKLRSLLAGPKGPPAST